MNHVAAAHVFALLAWGTLVLVELFVEFGARDDDGLRRAARTHFLIDLCLEVPLLLVVLGTGFALASRVPVWTALHILKVSAGLVAVSANLYCFAIVLRRHATRDRVERLRRDTTLIRIVSPAIGVPAGVVAAWIGFVHFMH
jgi:hypothetical protein